MLSTEIMKHIKFAINEPFSLKTAPRPALNNGSSSRSFTANSTTSTADMRLLSIQSINQSINHYIKCIKIRQQHSGDITGTELVYFANDSSQRI
jgi:hypothetical protein